MWVKDTPLHFIVDSDSQKNLISTKFVKRLALSTMPHPQPYTIGWLCQGSDLCVNQQCRLSYDIKPFKDEVLCDVCPLVITLNCTIPAYLASGLLMPLPSQSHAEEFLKKPLKTSNPRPDFSLGAGIRLLSLYCTQVSVG
jgi:hypothetical protein